MHRELLNFVLCPRCKNNLTLNTFYEKNKQIIDGIFICRACKSSFFIIDGIPRFLPISFIKNTDFFHKYITKYKEQIDSITQQISPLSREFKERTDKLAKLKQDTFKYFGFEWDFFKNWGWYDIGMIPKDRKIEYYGGLISDAQKAFKLKSLMKEEDLKEENVVLDAGCGNGRFINQAAQYGATCIGIDFAWGAVDAAYNHLKKNQNIHIIQGDLFNLPFKYNLFDTVFSIGVLMHTGNAQKAFTSISKHIKDKGVFTLHMYHKKNFIFEFNDSLLRSITTKLSIKNALRFSRFMAKMGKILRKLKFYNKILQLIQILPTLHHMYDWYSAPIATHHSYQEVERWFKEEGFTIIESEKPLRYSFFGMPESLTLKGQKQGK